MAQHQDYSEGELRSLSGEDAKARSKAVWALGDWSRIANSLDDASRALLEACGVGPEDSLLDVASGTGNAAIWAAKAGANVTATDLCPRMVADGQLRSDSEGFPIAWHEADMEALPFEDGSFDCVTSAFGIPFAPHPALAISELFRVTRLGGKVGLVNWTPEGMAGRLGGLSAKYSSGPQKSDGFNWGRAGKVSEVLRPLASKVELIWGLQWNESPSAMHWWENWKLNSPTMAAAAKTLAPEQMKSLGEDVVALIAASQVPARLGARWGSEYLIVVATKLTGPSDGVSRETFLSAQE